ncbi:MAG TPA: glycerophosphodiester phosphodiesterase family protein [Vineibacter sp.]|nr:glycerophosphodiester phosphodiesterase family protein [Vineibacter sp.]
MVLIIGHRGARNLWPENSLDGFRRTLALGVDGVELDVHLSRDGDLVVIHDPTLERTTEASGAVQERTAAELATIRLRDANGEGVPRLDDVLDIFRGSALELHLEIKTDVAGRAYPGLEARLLDAIQRHRLQQAIVTCFVPEVLQTVRRLDPNQRVLASLDRRSAELMGGIEPALDRFAAIDGCLMAVEKSLLTATLDLCRQKFGSERLGAWVPNDPPDITYWLHQPIRRITTDRPDLALVARRDLLPVRS